MKIFTKHSFQALTGILFGFSFLFSQADQVTAGSTVILSVTADGTAPFTYQWKKNASNLVGATSPTLTITNIQSSNAGAYSVTVANSAGSTASDVNTLSVVDVTSSPVITAQPQSKSVTVGTSVALSVTASGSPSPTFQWRKNGVVITGATSSSYTISNVASGSAATYTVVATNSAGTVTSAGAVLTVVAATVVPVITTQPAGATATAGANITLTGAANGTPTPTYQWKKNGVAIGGATNSSLTLTSITSANAGTYTLIATNSAGSVTSNGAVLTVKALPVVKSQTSSQLVNSGGTATFALAVSGTGTVSYQWQYSVDGGSAWANLTKSPIYSGITTASLSVSNAVLTLSGYNYRCIATDSVGSVASQPMLLTIRIIASDLDFNHDGYSAALWHNTVNGTVSSWTTKGFLAFGSEGGGWQVIGTGDFDGDGMSDILWHNTSTGVVSVVYKIGGGAVIGTEGGGWQVIGTGDFDGDGKADTLWRNTSTGVVSALYASGGGIGLGTEGGGWEIIGIGDFDGDGKADTLWHNTSSGMVSAVYASGGGISLGTEGGGWSVIGIGDFNGDGKADLIWHNTASGVVNAVFTQGDGGGLALGLEANGWQVMGTADFDGDGKVDVEWRNALTGLVASWTSSAGFQVHGIESSGWQVVQ